jgi:ParB-like chromosome segregation protein Spo0J
MENTNEKKDLRGQYIQGKEIHKIKLSDIILTETIHLTAKCDLTEQIERIRALNLEYFDNPIIIKPIENAQFSLLLGYNRYTIAKALEHEYICAIIEDVSRGKAKRLTGVKDRMEHSPEGTNGFLPIDKIVIPDDFKNTQPKQYKLDACREYYLKNKRFNKPIIIENDVHLVNGYTRYCIAVELGLKYVPVKFKRNYRKQSSS